ncbi:MAG: hypothetical protein GY828_05815, partial [Candidatus Gracilibacteria bacterium]|nr:hypothetical protein [Candidatus Gracilibacteria bacterium]
MSKNKIILIILAGLLFLFFAWVILNLDGGNDNADKTQGSQGEYTIWIYQDQAQ